MQAIKCPEQSCKEGHVTVTDGKLISPKTGQGGQCHSDRG